MSRTHRSHRRHRAGTKNMTPYYLLLTIGSAIALISILVLLNDVESAPPWKIMSLVASTILGLIICTIIMIRTKK